jgi:hypothetical protein
VRRQRESMSSGARKSMMMLLLRLIGARMKGESH